MRQIKQEAFFTGTAAQGGPVRSGDGSFRETNGRSSRVRGDFSALAEAPDSGPVSALPVTRTRDVPESIPPPRDSKGLNAEDAGRVQRHPEKSPARHFLTVLALVAAVSVMAGWALPSQAALYS